MGQAIYRKYRPKSFFEVFGQSHVARILTNQIKTGHFVHSYIFTGPRGIGKTTIARLLAKSLNCEKRAEGEYEPCNKCINCEAINIGNSLNIIEIDAASHTGVDNVRDKIIENVRFAPIGGKHKIFIIDEVHMLSTVAFNALLKTLEEPPQNVIFILATTELHKIPATILSRCQRFDFKKLSGDEIVDRLNQILKQEKTKVESKVLERIAYLSEGCLRDAESLLGQILGLGIKDIKEVDADLVLPRGDITLSLDFLETLVLRRGRDGMLILDSLTDQGINYKYFLDSVIELARKLLFLKITKEMDKTFSSDMQNKITKMLEGSDSVWLVKILDVLLLRRGDINMLDMPTLPLELAVAEICGEEEDKNKEKKNIEMPNLSFIPTSSSVISMKVGALHKKETNQVKDAEKNSYTVEKSCDISLIEQKWYHVLEKIKNYNHSLPFILGSAKPISFDGKTLLLAIKFKLHKEKLDDSKNIAILTEVLKSVYNMDIIVEVRIDESLPIEIKDEEDVDVESAFGV